MWINSETWQLQEACRQELLSVEKEGLQRRRDVSEDCSLDGAYCGKLSKRGRSPADDIQRLITSGEVDADDLLRREDWPNWRTASTINGILEVMSPKSASFLKHDEENQLTSQSVWYLLRLSDGSGIYTTAAIKAYANSGRLSPDDLLLHPEKHIWLPVRDVPLFDNEQLLITFKSVTGRRLAQQRTLDFDSRALQIEPLIRIRAHKRFVSCVSFSPSGKTLASGSADRTICIWDVATQERIGRCIGHRNTVSSISFSPDGNTLASGSWDGTIRLWESNSGDKRSILCGHGSAVNCVSHLPDGKRLISGGDDMTIRLWNSETGKETMQLETPLRVVHLALSPTGSHVLAVCMHHGSGLLYLYDLETGANQFANSPREGAGLLHVVVSPDSRYVAGCTDRGHIVVWDIEDHFPVEPRRWRAQANLGSIFAIEFSADSRTLASANSDGGVKLWDVATGKLLAVGRGHTSIVHDIAFAANLPLLASGGKDGAVLLWQSWQRSATK